MDCSASKVSDGDCSITNAHMDGSPEKSTDMTSMQGIDVDLRYACEPTSNNEDCSTSGSHHPENLRVQQRRINTYAAGERSKRKRWRGRHDDVGYIPSISSDESSKQELSTTTRVSSTYISQGQQVMAFIIFFSCSSKLSSS